MLRKMKRAVDPSRPTALNTVPSTRSYRGGAPESSAKSQIGEFLLYLCASGRPSGSLWRHLEAELRGGLG